ncbi:hypothetical protein RSOL_402920 [Rhizoctonia solani AG-3 Rhs1AP]|uniref:Uncharacterized protein n=2 Tax=Rhizoctonia solani AG-3 TaxID=1086053 RepID=A0A074RFZ6_9AGAM|nr:hypothetical protein RSOL_402920 [Rhizoctonia solani AG-3 Rhs1AP]KEP45684.1 hypothetical protein V565_250090 [Rhizoctonia solani 123E]
MSSTLLCPPGLLPEFCALYVFYVLIHPQLSSSRCFKTQSLRRQMFMQFYLIRRGIVHSARRITWVTNVFVGNCRIPDAIPNSANPPRLPVALTAFISCLKESAEPSLADLGMD